MGYLEEAYQPPVQEVMQEDELSPAQAANVAGLSIADTPDTLDPFTVAENYKKARENAQAASTLVSDHVSNVIRPEVDVASEMVSQGEVTAPEATSMLQSRVNSILGRTPTRVAYDAHKSPDTKPIDNTQAASMATSGAISQLTSEQVFNQEFDKFVTRSSDLSIFKDILEGIAPASFTYLTHDAVQFITGQQDVPYAMGNAYNHLAHYMKTLPTEKDRVLAVQRAFKWMNKDSGFLPSDNQEGTINHLVAFSLLEHVQGVELNTAWTWFENAMTILDVLPVPITALRAAKKVLSFRKSDLFNRTKGSGAIDVANEADPEKGANIKAEVYNQDAQIDKAATGVDTDSIAMDMLPIDRTEDPMVAGRAALVDKVNENNPLAITDELQVKGMFDEASRTQALVSKVQSLYDGTAGKVGRAARILRMVVTTDGATHEVKKIGDFITKIQEGGTVKAGEQGFTVKAMYGTSSGKTSKGFANAFQAKRESVALGIPDNEVSLWHREAGTGKLFRIIDKNQEGKKAIKVIDDEGKVRTMKDPDVFMQVDHKYSYVRDDIIDGGDPMVIRGYGPKTSWLISTAYKVAPWLRDLAQTSHDVEKGLRDGMQSSIKASVQGLSYGEERHLATILYDNAGDSINHGARLDRTELLARYNTTDAVADAYETIRDTYDILYHASNGEERARLARRGVQALYVPRDAKAKSLTEADRETYITISGDKDLTFNEVIANNPKGRTEGQLYDPATGEVHIVNSQGDIDRLLKKGYRLRKTDNPEGIPNKLGDVDDSYEFILVHPKRAELNSLPHHVLRYNPGYIPKHYNSAYFIEQVIHGTKNGLPNVRKVAQGAAITEMSAHARKERMLDEARIKWEEENSDVIDNVLKNESPERAESIIDKMWEREKPRFEVKRADEIEAKGKGDSFTSRSLNSASQQQHQVLPGAELEDPLTGLYRSISAITTQRTYGKMFEQMETRFLKQYGKYLNDPKDMDSGWKSKLATEDMQRQADEVHNIISMYKGVQDPVDSWVQIRMIRLADFWERNGINFLVKPTLRRRNMSISSNARGAAFTVLLGMNPLRQFVMQGLQFTFIAGIDPAAAGGAVRLGYHLMHGATLKQHNPAKYAQLVKRASKAAGISQDEFKALMASWQKSGIPNSIDATMWMVEGLHEAKTAIAKTAGQHRMRTIANGARYIPRKMQKYGFNLGEYTNLSMTYAFSFLRAVKRDGSAAKVLANKDALIGIAADTKTLALSPNRTGAFRWQTGWPSFGTQFLAFQYKAIELLVHGTREGKVTKRQAAQLLSAQAVMWGTTGLGLDRVYQYIRDKTGVEVDPATDIMWRGGFADWSMYQMMNLMEKDPDHVATLALSKSFSPLPKIDNLGAAIHSMVSYGVDPNLFETFFGASGAVASSMIGAMENIYAVVRAPDLDTDTKVLQAIRDLTTIVPLLDNVTKASLGYRIDYALSSRDLSPTVRQEASEFIARALFGVSTYKHEDYWNNYIDQLNWRKSDKALGNIMAQIYNSRRAALGPNATPSQVKKLTDEISTLAIGKSKAQQMELLRRIKPQLVDRSNPGWRVQEEQMTKSMQGGDQDFWDYMATRILNDRNIPESEKDLIRQTQEARHRELRSK